MNGLIVWGVEFTLMDYLERILESIVQVQLYDLVLFDLLFSLVTITYMGFVGVEPTRVKSVYFHWRQEDFFPTQRMFGQTVRARPFET